MICLCRYQGESIRSRGGPAAGSPPRVTMTNHGDDCYFFYYSTCTKGDSCPFRHCEAAMGNETVCNLWQEGRCFRTVCKFRHMEITKNRKEIPCYWEKQPAGCQKPHCAFFHERPRFVEGIFVPPDKIQSKSEEQPEEEPAPPSSAPPLPPANTANPQLRGVIKTESQEPVPSPTHPPVVINPVDDDEDEEDQFSEEGEDGKVGASPRKFSKSGDSLNFGVSTLEEIRLRKALKSSMRRAGSPIHRPQTTNGEKENIQALYRPAHSEIRGPVIFEEQQRPRGRVMERLGRRISSADFKSMEGPPLKKSLAERLGRTVDEEPPPVGTQKALKPVKERLGLVPPVRGARSAEATAASAKAPELIRIKTLEEIRQDKAAKSSGQNDAPSAAAAELPNTDLVKGIKRSVTVRGAQVSHVKTFSEIVRAKKRKQEEQQNQNPDSKEEQSVEKPAGKSPEGAPDVEKVRVKTLEEIRREKAARVQAQQAEAKQSADAERSAPKRRQLLRMKKPPSQPSGGTPETTPDTSETPRKTAAAPAETIKVKTFEEIMQEKRLRKQEMEVQGKSAAEADSSENPPAGGTLKRKLPAKICLTSAESSSPSAASPPSRPVRKLLSLKPRAPSPMATPPSAGPSAGDRSPPQQPVSQSPSTDAVDRTQTCPAPHPATQLGGKSAQAADDRAVENLADGSKTRAVCSKVRPKLNVRPSVVKPAGRPAPAGQRKRGADASAVAAVKPMNSSAAHQSSNKEAELPPAVPPTAPHQGEELQPAPVSAQLHGRNPTAAASGAADPDTHPGPQSPGLKSPTQSKPRRPSMAASRTTSSTDASVDDFETLINQFTDDHLEEDVDPAIGEDDLLQELSEMIDS
ncbi:PREDICTED: zinc finger CCCH domain-containing protein 11A [Cyprinodon variegatus]|uniref:zinc finger CCCH domain-containing protein 11A n=1 Tax=Cyprinodon variegatus TaxID=28743 RepID=UPI0007426F04|nr:PREDICTED: zinc finger CCCH domain-containing protein 11A [Cyprinodon variegatus]